MRKAGNLHGHVFALLLSALMLPAAPAIADVSKQSPQAWLANTPLNIFRKRVPKLCGSKGLQGAPAEPIRGPRKGCGVTNGVHLTAVRGVRLSRPATINCETALALEQWVAQGVLPAVGNTGGGVAQLQVVEHYACRNRNHRAGARLSEHAKGNAVDISAIVLKNGAKVDVLTGWRDKNEGPILRKVHKAACGPFGTVLGPQADRHHRDHFHFDVAKHRNGPYCR